MKAGKVRMREDVAGAERANELIICLLAAEALDHAIFRGHDPVVRDAKGRVPLRLGGPIIRRGGGRKDLHNQRGRAFNPARGHASGLGDHHKVWLDGGRKAPLDRTGLALI